MVVSSFRRRPPLRACPPLGGRFRPLNRGTPLDRSNAIARYVFALKHGADSTNRAEDRPHYVRLLSDAAVLLAVETLEGSDDQPFRANRTSHLRHQSKVGPPESAKQYV